LNNTIHITSKYSDTYTIEHSTILQELITSTIYYNEVSVALELIGTGFKAIIHETESPLIALGSENTLSINTKRTLNMYVGQHNPIKIPIPADLKVFILNGTKIFIKGRSKETVHNFAAMLRNLKKPNIYTGKGIRYLGEHVKCKPGKKR
jgi:ribosomal protein L6P/L9E